MRGSNSRFNSMRQKKNRIMCIFYDYQQVVTSIGMLHIGVVFVVFGIFLLGAGLIPDDVSSQNAWSIFAKDSWWNELVLTGLFAIGLGVFLIVLNSIISKKEEDDLEAYVQSQLTRSRSGKYD